MSDYSYEDIFCRNYLLWGAEAQEKLRQSHVLLAGLGGVGSYVAEALARAGIGALTLVDFDLVAPSNINRQLPAVLSQLGRPKTELMAQRIADINPQCKIEQKNMQISPANAAQLGQADYFVDAIDDLAGKVALIHHGWQLGRPLASSMGVGRRLAPECLRLADLSRSKGCPLARSLRRELRALGIEKGITVVYSEEAALPAHPRALAVAEKRPGGKQPLGSCSFVPAMAGMLLASAVIRDLAGIAR